MDYSSGILSNNRVFGLCYPDTMKTNVVRFITLFLLLGLAIYPDSSAQPESGQKMEFDCNKQPLGAFRQVTGSSLEQYNSTPNGLIFDSKSDRRDDRWPLGQLDEVDPAYKIYLIRNPSFAGKSCGPTMKVLGKLISPTGKLLEFKQAIYDFRSHKLTFTTIERDGIIFDAEIQFFRTPVSVNNMYHEGTLKLKATGKSLGTVSIESPLTSWNSH